MRVDTSSHCPFVAASLQALYQSWVLDACRNILAILEDMPSLRPPIDHLCELLPRLQARYYSIASSSKVISWFVPIQADSCPEVSAAKTLKKKCWSDFIIKVEGFRELSSVL